MTADDTRLALVHAIEETQRLAESWAQFARSLGGIHPLSYLASGTASQFYQVLDTVQQHPAVRKALTERAE